MFGQNKENLEDIAESCFLSDVNLDNDNTFNWQTPAVSNNQEQDKIEQNTENSNHIVNEVINSLRSRLDILLNQINTAPYTPQIEFLKALIINDITTFENTIADKIMVINTAINRMQTFNQISTSDAPSNQINVNEPMIITLP